MKVEEVLAKKDSLFGREIIVEGILIERAPEYHFYLAPDKQSREDLSKSILIIPPFSSDELENRLPGILVGSRYSFVDPARVTGQLIASGDKNFPAALTALTHLTVSTSDDDKEFDIPLDP